MNPNAIEAVQALGAVGAASGAGQAQAATPQPATGFVQWMEHGITDLNKTLLTAEQGVQQLAAGTAGNLHDVMLQLEQARLAMQVASQVRSRVMEAYQEVMRMQV
ncbi:flagellar hook-basal body complex protein FliE [Roseateles sp. DB2]|uniref:flagellar hook-basal body complex protein FliE n=1 Tax=Roseateles sp. DB2 TaxID=3453717 RepID=UPI003EED2D74